MKTILLFLLLSVASSVLAQSPSPTPVDNRGLGIQQSGPTSTNTQTASQSREAKPELVLQTGYNNIFGATRMVFSPDGRLLATGTYRSNTIKLWETATNRKLRDLSSSGQTAPGLAPAIAFSRDSRLIATSTADNAVKIWDVNSGRDVLTLAGPQATISAAIGVYFIGFAADNRLVTVSDAVHVWDLSTGRELRTLELGGPNSSAFTGGDGGIAISTDGTQLVLLSDDSEARARVNDLATGREVQSVKLSNKRIDTMSLAFAPDGRIFAAVVADNRLKLWDLATKKEQELTQTTKEYPQLKFSRDGRLLALSDKYVVRIWDVANARELTQLKVPNSGALTSQADANIAFSDDGKRIATGGFDTDTIIWES